MSAPRGLDYGAHRYSQRPSVMAADLKAAAHAVRLEVDKNPVARKRKIVCVSQGDGTDVIRRPPHLPGRVIHRVAWGK